MFLFVGAAFVVVAECVIPTVFDDDKQLPSNVVGIEVVCDSEYFVNQPLSLDGAMIKLKLEGETTSMTFVELKQSNVANFSTSKVGEFEMVVFYGSFSCTIPYSVSYKKIDFGSQIFDFEVGQNIDLNSCKVFCYDYYDNVKNVISFEDVEIENLNTETLAENKTATIKYNGFSKDFVYSVFHFSRSLNYVGTAAQIVDDCSYEILSFVASSNSKLKVAKKIDSLDLVERIYEFDLKRVDDSERSVFISDKAIGKLDFETKKLTIYKNVMQNSQQLVFDLVLGDAINLNQPHIKAISGVKNLKQTFVLNEEVLFDDMKVVLLMSDNSQREIDIDASNISNFVDDEVGAFKAQISFYSFVYEHAYLVNYKAIEFYDKSLVYEFNLNGNEIFDMEIVCYDAQDLPVAIKKLSAQDVLITGFDNTILTDGATRTAQVVCYGATFEFDYLIKC